MSNFDRFTERARKVLQLAQEESQRFNHNYIGTEHLLLGLVREGDGVAARVLKSMGVQLPKVRAAVEFIIGRGQGQVTGDVGLTPRAKAVLELSVEESRRLNHGYIGTEHILLGLLREGEGIGAGVLESLGVNLDRARQAVMLGTSGSPPLPSSAPDTTAISAFLMDITARAGVHAGQSGRDQIETTDILFASLTDRDGRARRVLEECGIHLEPGALQQPESRAADDAAEDGEQAEFTLESISSAVDLFGRMRFMPLGSDHILLALIDLNEPNLVDAMLSAAVSLESIRTTAANLRQPPT